MNIGLGEKLFALRQKRNEYQKQSAEGIGISEQSYQRFETNAALPSLERLISIAAYFGVPISYLMGEEQAIDERDRKLLNIYHDLTDDEKDMALTLLDAYLRARR